MTPLPESVEHHAVELIRALCAVAGDDDRVLAAMRDYGAENNLPSSELTAVASIALLVTFSRCLTSPVEPPPLTAPTGQPA